MATIKVYPKKNQLNKHGLCSIQLEAQSKGAKIRKSIKSFKINPEYWDYENSRVTEKQSNYQGINRLIKKSLDELEKVVVDMEYDGRGFNRDIIKAKINGFDETSVYEFWGRVIESEQSKLSTGTLNIYENALMRLKEFKGTLLFCEVTLEFLNRFEGFLRDVHKNRDNTIHKIVKCLRKVINIARKTLKVDCDAFDLYRLPGEETVRDSLDLEEVDSLLELLYSKKIEKGMGKDSQQTLALFCFQCLTGLRFSDAERFNVPEFVRGTTIRVGTDKTGKAVYIPFHKRLLDLMDFVGYEFKPPTLQAANRILKAIALVQGITIKLSSHIAVHTFCVVCLELGVDIKVISKLRGHRSVKTTEIYLRVKDKHVDKQMEKWDA